MIIFRGEESSRFSVGTMGSKVMAGVASVDAWRALQDHAGTTLAQALATRGLALERLPEAARRRGELKAFVEMHIEQGPVLEAAGIPIGIVEAIAAPIRLKITVEGEAAHSGTTPMGRRHDALVTAAQVVLAVQEAAASRAERRIVGTVGAIRVHPGSINVVPGTAELWIDIRGIDAGLVAATAEAVREAADAIARREGTRITAETLSVEAPVPMDPGVVGAIEAACQRMKLAARRLPSGAGHDAMNMARLAPAGMIFIPCRGGISHNPAEHTSPEAICSGDDVLTETLRDLAG